MLAGDGSRLPSDEIDRDPLALLPSGPIALVHLDVKAAFASQLGEPVGRLVKKAVPLGVEANFDAQRDVSRVIVGVYSLQGADVAAVVQGTFDPEAIKIAASQGVPTALGAPLTKLSYAGNDLFVAGGVGFVVVTRKTAVAGNETGIRRVLDRIRDKRVRREVPEWMATLVDTPKASIVGAGDLAREPQVQAAAQQLGFLNGLTVARVLGNFESPGINFAGSLTYPDAASAEKAAGSLETLSKMASYTQLLALLGMKPPVQNMQVKKEGNDVQFVIAVEGQSIAGFLDMAGAYLGAGANKQIASPLVMPGQR